MEKWRARPRQLERPKCKPGEPGKLDELGGQSNKFADNKVDLATVPEVATAPVEFAASLWPVNSPVTRVASKDLNSEWGRRPGECDSGEPTRASSRRCNSVLFRHCLRQVWAEHPGSSHELVCVGLYCGKFETKARKSRHTKRERERKSLCHISPSLH